MSIIELMHQIVREPAPRLLDVGPDGTRRFPIEAGVFVDACLEKNVEARGMPRSLSVSLHSWFDTSRSNVIEIAEVSVDRNDKE